MLSRVDTFNDEVVAQSPRLKAFALSLCRRNEARAEDLVQDTIVAALSNKDKFKPDTNLAAWLFMILKNKFRSGFRKGKREVEDPDEMMAKAVPLEDSPLKKMEVAELLRLIDKMPESFRVPLRLIADGATYEEVAEEIREHIGTVKSRVNRGRQMLKAAE